MLYFLLSTLVLTLYIDVVLSLSIRISIPFLVFVSYNLRGNFKMNATIDHLNW